MSRFPQLAPLGQKKIECFLKVLKGQGPHSWMEASQYTQPSRLGILRNFGCPRPLGVNAPLKPLTAIGSLPVIPPAGMGPTQQPSS